jgi:formylglycine-generating enzyme required for sulfatase activity
VILVEVDPAVAGSPSERFCIAPYPVTYRDWDRFCLDNALQRPSDDNGDAFPVVGIHVGQALMYCNWLSREEGLSPCYELVHTRYDDPERGVSVGASHRFRHDRGGYRLPMVQEWLWAARGGLLSRNTRHRSSSPASQPTRIGRNETGHAVGRAADGEVGS